MPKNKGKRETIALTDLMVGLATGDINVAKKITRKGSKNRLVFSSISYLSNFSTPEQKAQAGQEIKYALMKQTGRAIEKKTKGFFDN